MQLPPLPAPGGCRCGATRVAMTAAPLLTSACHCSGCRTMSGSAFSLSILLPEAGLEVAAGAPVQGGLHDPNQQHMFCPDCMTWMFTRLPQFGLVNLRPGVLEEHGWFAPFIDTFLVERLPWATTPARHGFTGFPPPERHEALLAEFRAMIGAPA